MPDWLPTWEQAIAAGTTLAAILAWAAKLRWSKQYKEAKDAEIQSIKEGQAQVEKSKDAQIESLKEGEAQLRGAKDAHIANLEGQVDFLETVSSKEYLHNLASQNQELQKQKEELQEELTKLKSEVDRLQVKEEAGREPDIPHKAQTFKESFDVLKKSLTEVVKEVQSATVLEWDPSLVIGPRVSWMHFTDGLKALPNMGNAALFPIKVGTCTVHTWFRDNPDEKRTKAFLVDTIMQPGQQPDLIKALRFSHDEVAGPRLNPRNLRDTYRELMYELEVELLFSPKPGKSVASTGPKAAFAPDDGWWFLLQHLGPDQFKHGNSTWQLAIIGQDLWDRQSGNWSIKAQLAQVGGDQVFDVTYRMKAEIARALRKQFSEPGAQAERIWDGCKKCIHTTVSSLPKSQKQEIIIELRNQEILQPTPEDIERRTDGKPTRDRILLVLLGHDDSGSPTFKMDKELAGELDLPLKHVQDQMLILESQGVVQMVKAFGPSYGARITSQGRLYLEEH